MTNTESEPISWRSYYNREPEIHRFVPEVDPTESFRLSFVQSLLPGEPLDSILDAGCGDGYQCASFASRARVVIGVDVSFPRVQYARGHHNAANVVFVNGELVHPPFKPHSFDLVTLVEVLEHMPNPSIILQTLASLSRRYLLITVPYKETPLVVLCPHCLKQFPVDGHLHRFDEPSFRTTLEQAGLRILKIDKFANPSPWENVFPIRYFSRGGKTFIRTMLQNLSLVSKDNALFIGALCEI
jgi:SAM-dependent methyltransferase